MKFPHRKRPGRKRKNEKELTPQQIQQRKLDAGLPAYGTGFLGVYVIRLAIVRKERSSGKRVAFNADIPQPKGDG